MSMWTEYDKQIEHDKALPDLEPGAPFDTEREYKRAAQTCAEYKAKTAHTPGPWAVQGGKGRKGELYVWMQGTYMGGHAIATVHDGVPESARANAALIAASPDLLAALERCVPRLESHSTHCARDVAAATGVDDQELIATFIAENAPLQQARAAIAKAKGETP